MAYINWGAVLLNSKLDDLDSAINTRTKAAWSRKQQAHWPLIWPLQGMLFSHRQCPLGNVDASAKRCPLLRVANLGDKELEYVKIAMHDQNIS